MKKWNEIVIEARGKMNQKDYKFYVLNKKSNKIRSGWEYKEDAEDAKKEDSEAGKILTAQGCKNIGIDVNDNSVWGYDD